MKPLRFLVRDSLSLVCLTAGIATSGEIAPVRSASDAPGTPGLAIPLDTLRGRDPATLQEEFADYARLGIRWLRTDLYWADVQANGPDSFDWSEFDHILKLAEDHDLWLLPVVGTTPKWAQKDKTRPSTPANPADFARFMEEAVRRYTPRGIHAWEIWNEPNMAGAWPPHPDPEGYAELLIAAHDAIKTANPDALVIFGGLAAANWTGPVLDVQYVAATTFLDAVYDAGAGNAFDAMSFHPYSYPDMPNPDWRWNGWGMMHGPLRQIMKRRGDGDKKVWITEFGAPSNAGHGGISEDEQAALLRESIAIAYETKWAGPVFWYSYRDRGSDMGNNEHWFGLIDKNGRRKPAWTTLRAASDQFPLER
ncbi:MAG: cellulase family glycosylhydrolase [Paracoccus sp. (in: a-proteobacteria)]